MHGAARPTFDVDVTPSVAPTNLRRLADALAELDARIRTASVEGGLPFSASADSLRGLRILNLTTAYGDLDLTFEAAGVGGYDTWAANAERYEIGRLTIRVASLEDVVRSKRAAGRAKDLDALPELLALAAGQDPDPGGG